MSVEGLPSVSILLPVLNEEDHLHSTLASIGAQDYPNLIEVLVVDGGSTDATRAIASAWPGVTVLENPARIQAAALNLGIAAAAGEVLVRVDGHCRLEPDYVRQCVEALERSGAAMVGGAMTPVASGWRQRGIAVAMASRMGAGPARFHVGGSAGWVDTVYLGAYRADVARAAGGYSTDVGVNEDAEFAHRMAAHGRVWFEPAIRSTYVPRSSVRGVARQFWRYGLSRAATVRRHPRSLKPRQLAPLSLAIGLLSPQRRKALLVYSGVVAGASVGVMRRDGPRVASIYAVTLPVMHLSWAAGFVAGILGVISPPRPYVVSGEPDAS